VFELRLKVGEMDCDQVQFQMDVNLLEDHMIDVEMSALGAHHMISSLKDDVRDLNNSTTNLHN
jgi:hypothetical protein